MKKTITTLRYYFLFIFIGFFIYKFQIEKSFNLLTIYVLSISFSAFALLFKIESKKTLPFLFLSSLFIMYGTGFVDGVFEFQWKQFFILLTIFSFLLLVLIYPYPLRYKKIISVLCMLALASVYLIKGDLGASFKFLPYVIGSFFMFRTVSYLYELKFLKKEASVLDNLNYFLLAPNFSLPLFPIVDYKSFISSYEGINANTLKRSSLFICRGFFQMILYRFVYHDLIIPFNEIHNFSQVLIFLVCNFLIILRVIGAFHIAIGLVILSGYNIPDLFNNIFFSTGFSNLWRRTNMYWKNFVIKIFYYPIYFKIKKIGIYQALFIATFICFGITWVLHSYQWYWIKGSLPFELKDAIFWGSFGLLVAGNTMIQQKQLDKKQIDNKVSKYDFVVQACYGLGVLLVMSVLWSIWTTRTLGSWWNLMQNLKVIDIGQLFLCFKLAIFYIVLASCYHYYQKHKDKELVWLKAKMTMLSYIGFFGLIFGIFASSLIAKSLGNMYYGLRIIPLISERLNEADLQNIDNGYYTNLISTNDYCSQVWTNQLDITRSWTQYINMNATRYTHDIMLAENIPNTKLKFKDISYSINADGLHDKAYPKIKPDSCYRIIVLGGSYECGNGVTDGQDFISLVETQLNNDYTIYVNGEKKHLELINFSVNGYMLMQRYHQYLNKARQWNPDATLLFMHTDYRQRIVNYIYRLVYQNNKVNDAYLKQLLDKKHITKNDDNETLKQKLGDDADSINVYAVRGISRIAKEDSTTLVSVFLPALKDKVLDKDLQFLHAMNQECDMKGIELLDVFSKNTSGDLSLSDVDFHPNKKANDLVAAALLKGMIAHQNYFNIQFIKK